MTEAGTTGLGVTVSVPASSANLGPGLDVLGLALGLHATAGTGETMPEGAHRCAEHHPAQLAYRAAGGAHRLWVHAPIPMGRGLGYSGAVRVAGALMAVAEQDPSIDGAPPADRARQVLEVAAAAEGHADNAAASVYGGLVVVAGSEVAAVPVAFDAAVVVWVPDGSTTSTTASRASLPTSVGRDDAVFNIGRTAALVTAFATGDVATLGAATEDRLHQAVRLAAVPASAAALEVGRRSGAWCGWLSGSGPSIAFLCAPSAAAGLAAALPAGGHTKILAIDRLGCRVHRER